MKLDLMILASCIATGEGEFAPGNPPPVRNNNPGDVRFAGQHFAVESVDGRVFDSTGKKVVPGFAKWARREQGIAGLLIQIMLGVQRGENLAELMSIWAPPKGPDGGNPTAVYIAETIRRYKVGTVSAANPDGDTIDPTIPLWTWLTLVHLP